jgi:hypothetical protein
MRSTISEALREMRGLHSTDAGRLRGIHLRYGSLSLPQQLLSQTPQPWRATIEEASAARDTGSVTPDSPEYLVFSDRTLVAVLSAAGRVALPDYRLSRLQAKHQEAAAQALGDLARHALGELADQRATMDGRDHDAAAEYQDHPGGALRVAPANDPTNTRWVHIGPDLHHAHRTIQRACHTQPEQVLIITAAGYGTYGRDRHRLRLDVLCAMHQVADAHQVRLCTVGDWLDAEGATTSDINPQTIIEQFAIAYIGPFGSALAYTQHRMAELGWTQALQTAGIPASYLNTAAINRDWFRHQVRQINSGVHGRIEVFHRSQTD